MSFPQSGESTFPDSRTPVRMDTEDHSFGGKPSHGTHGTHGTQTTESTFPDSRNPVGTEDQSFAGKHPHGTHGTHGTHTTESTFPDSRNPVGTEDQSFAGKHSHGTHGTHGTHTTNATNTNNDSTFVEVMPLTGASLAHPAHRDNEPLPGAKGGAKTFDYSPENIENTNNLPTGPGQSQPLHSGEQTGTGGHANTARAYGGSTTEASGDFRGPTIASTTDRHDAGTSNFASGQHGKDLDSYNTHKARSHVPEPVGDLKPHTGNNNASVGRTDNYNTVSAAGNHDLNHPSHHAGVTGGANKAPYDGAGNEPTNKPSITDKLIGKTEQIAGKISNNPELQEKGEVRKAGLQRN